MNTRIKTPRKRKKMRRQISLLEEENEVAKMKDLQDNLSRELESTTQEFLQISKKAYITEQEKESNEESTIYADKVKKGTEPQEQFYKLPDSLMAQLPDYIGKNTLPDGMCLINAVSQHLGCNALTMAEILNNIMINNKEVF